MKPTPLFTIFTAFSAILMLTAFSLWSISHFRHFMHSSTDGRAHYAWLAYPNNQTLLQLAYGKLVLQTNHRSAPTSRDQSEVGKITNDQFFVQQLIFHSEFNRMVDGESFWQRHGLNFRRLEFHRGSVRYSELDLSVPLWLPGVLFSILPVIATVQWIRRRKMHSRQCAGLCVRCGYDLRSSSDRCPECGRDIPRVPAGETRPS